MDHCRRGDRKIIKARATEVFCETVSPKMSESTPMNSYQEDLNNDNITEYVNMEGGSLWGLNPTQGTTDNWGKLTVEEMAFPRVVISEVICL